MAMTHPLYLTRYTEEQQIAEAVSRRSSSIECFSASNATPSVARRSADQELGRANTSKTKDAEFVDLATCAYRKLRLVLQGFLQSLCN